MEGLFRDLQGGVGIVFQRWFECPGKTPICSAPMGWSNIVDFVQSSLEKMGTLAGIPSAQVVRMGEPSPLLELTTPRSYFSFYVDNFDGFKIIAASDQASYEGRPSDEQLRLREIFRVWGVERDPRKAAEGTLSWQSLGAEQLGDEGMVGSARSFRRGLLGATIWLLGRASEMCGSSQELLTVTGKHMHSVQYCRPLASCFDEIYHVINLEVCPRGLPIAVLDDLMMVTGFLPQHWMDQKLEPSPVAYATDASEDGGGACCSTGLSARGRAKCHLACCDLNDREGGLADPIVLIEAFGGIGGLRKFNGSCWG